LNRPVKVPHHRTPSAINPTNLLPTANDRKVIEGFGLNPIHGLEYRRLDTAKPGAIGIDLALPGVGIKVNTPPILSH